MSTYKPIRDYDSTIARIAGNIAAGMCGIDWAEANDRASAAMWAVDAARRIVAEVKRTEPPQEST